MSEKKRILIQLDSDLHPSVFDRVVAVDAGAEVLMSYGSVTPEAVRDLVYGAMFTRGADDLKHSAVFIGGGDVTVGEAMMEAAKKSFLGPLRVSLMLDCGGANTTAAAACVVASRNAELQGAQTLVLGSTGPVGQRVTRLLARQGARVRATSRRLERAAAVAEQVREAVPGAEIEPLAVSQPTELEAALSGVSVVVAAGGPGVCLLPLEARKQAQDLKLVIDLNAVPPEGI